jgi:hypothetical protein
MEAYTLNIKEASRFFGFAPQTFYNWINNGKLIRGYHYLKVGNKPMIKREKFIEWMEEQDSCK